MKRSAKVARSCPGWLVVATITAFVCACSSEDSVGAPSPGSQNGGVAVAGVGATGGVGAIGGAGVAGSVAGTAAVGATGGVGGTAGVGATGGTAGTAGAGATGGEAGAAGVGATGGEAGTAGEAGVGATGGEAGGGGTGAADADCDMNGIWVVRMLSIVQALGLEQCGNIYHYLELSQEGTDVEIVNHFNCSIEGRGSANSAMNDATIQSFISTNSMIGRKGTMMKTADGTCQLEFEPWWMAFGVDEATYLPTPRNSSMSLQDLQSANPFPMTADGAIDPDNDGQPGVQLIVTGAVNGSRHITQRVVMAWMTNDRYKITPALDWTDDFEIGNWAEPEEYTVATTPPNNPFLMSPALPVNSDAARVTFKFLGRDTSDPRVAGVVVSSDPTDLEGATQTCKNIVSAIPPIGPLAFPNPQLCPCPDGNACM